MSRSTALLAGTSVIVDIEESADLERLGELLRVVGDVSGVEVIATIASELEPDVEELISRSRLGIASHQVRILSFDSPLDWTSRRSQAIMAARYECVAMTCLPRRLPADLVPGSDGDPKLVLAVEAEVGTSPMAGVATGGWLKVATALAAATPVRSTVPIRSRVVGLPSRVDSWIDFAIRVLALAPLSVVAVHPDGSTDAPAPELAIDSGADDPIAFLTATLAVACTSAAVVNDAMPRIQQLASDLLTVPASRVNAFLKSSPQLHVLVIDILRRSGVRHFPFSVMNDGLARDLVIAYGFSPFTDTSGLVFARRTYERSAVVDLISKDLTDWKRRDDGSKEIAAEFVARHDFVDGAVSFDDWNAISTFCSKGLETANQWHEERSYRRLFSRSMWPASHYLGALLKLEHPELEWIAEFSDPMRRDLNNLTRSAPIGSNAVTTQLARLLKSHGRSFPEDGGVYDWAEDLPYLFADKILFTNQNQLDFMLSYCPAELVDSVRQKSSVEHHPTPPGEFYSRSLEHFEFRTDLVQIGYFGVFYPTRGLEPITAAIKSLPPAVRDGLQLNVFCPRPIEMERIAAEAGLQDVVVARPYLAYFDFLRTTTQLDCLLVDDYRTSQTHSINPYLPSKWSDYVGSGTPVWRVTEPGSVLSSMTSAYQSDLGDVEGAKKILQEILDAGPRQGQPKLASGYFELA